LHLSAIGGSRSEWPAETGRARRNACMACPSAWRPGFGPRSDLASASVPSGTPDTQSISRLVLWPQRQPGTSQDRFWREIQGVSSRRGARWDVAERRSGGYGASIHAPIVPRSSTQVIPAMPVSAPFMAPTAPFRDRVQESAFKIEIDREYLCDSLHFNALPDIAEHIGIDSVFGL